MPSSRNSDEVTFLSVDEVLAIYERVLEAFGGERGLRDLGLLESALFRPQTGYYEDLAEMGAALFESLFTNHPYLDGNKRVAFFATDVFFRANGWKFEVDAKETSSLLTDLLDRGECDFEHLLAWIRRSMVEID